MSWSGGSELMQFFMRSMNARNVDIEALIAEREKLSVEVLRLRVAIAKAAQRADYWPDSNDDPAEVLGDCASILFNALDYSQTET
jgi:hypothetical protein